MIIYCTTNKINNKKYIGKDSKNETTYYGSGKGLQNAINKYGIENFEKVILEEIVTTDDHKENLKLLSERELYWIDEYNAVKDPMYYNQRRVCGPQTWERNWPKLSDETKQKISKSTTGKKKSVLMRQRLSESKKGVAKTEEEKESMRIAANKRWSDPAVRKAQSEKIKGTKWSDERKKKHSESQKARRLREKGK